MIIDIMVLVAIILSILLEAWTFREMIERLKRIEKILRDIRDGAE